MARTTPPPEPIRHRRTHPRNPVTPRIARACWQLAEWPRATGPGSGPVDSISVLRGSSIKLHRGEVVGLIGENGSGNSTLMQILAGSVALGSADADRRLVRSGYRTPEVLVARLGIVAAACLLTTGVALVVTAASHDADSWTVFALANVLVALTYAMIGVLVGPRAGLLGGLHIMLALQFLDIGIAQNAMFDAAPPAWATYMPGFGGVRVLLDGAFTNSFDELGALLLALAWLAALTLAAAAQFHRLAQPRSRRPATEGERPGWPLRNNYTLSFILFSPPSRVPMQRSTYQHEIGT